MLGVTEVDVDGGQEDGQGGRQHQQSQHGGHEQRQVVQRRLEPERRQCDHEHDGLEEEEHQRRPDGGQGEHLAGEGDLLDEPGPAHDGRGGAHDRGGEEVPDQEPAEQEDGEVRDRVAEGDLEDEEEHGQVQSRVEHGPDEPEHAVLVLDLELLADQAEEQLPVTPQIGDPPPDRDVRGHDPGGRVDALAGRAIRARGGGRLGRGKIPCDAGMRHSTQATFCRRRPGPEGNSTRAAVPPKMTTLPRAK